MPHIPVLLGEAIKGLDVSEGKIVIDATLGNGGHSEKILENLKNGTLVAIDMDQAALDGCREKLEKLAQKNSNDIFFVRDNFANLEKVLADLKIEKIDAVLADLGWRIEQAENEEYGLSFKRESGLDMRLDKETAKLSAKDIVNGYSEKELAEIFKEYGEERYAKIAAKAISAEREKGEIKTTKELAEIIEKGIGKFYRKSKIHPATRIFQALRIKVNNEIENLRKLLLKATEHLKNRGRLAIISFHSLEDREVKKFFQANARGCICPKDAPICFCGKKPALKIITKKPIIPDEKESAGNPRSRSAKLRIAEKV